MRRALAAPAPATRRSSLPRPRLGAGGEPRGHLSAEPDPAAAAGADQLRRGGLRCGAAVAPRRRGGAGPQGEICGALLDRVSALEEEVRRLRGRLEEGGIRASASWPDASRSCRATWTSGCSNRRPAGAAGPPAARGRRRAPRRRRAPPARHRGAARPPERAIADGQAALGRRDFAAAEAAAREALAGREQPARHRCAVAAGRCAGRQARLRRRRAGL